MAHGKGFEYLVAGGLSLVGVGGAAALFSTEVLTGLAMVTAGFVLLGVAYTRRGSPPQPARPAIARSQTSTLAYALLGSGGFILLVLYLAKCTSVFRKPEAAEDSYVTNNCPGSAMTREACEAEVARRAASQTSAQQAESERLRASEVAAEQTRTKQRIAALVAMTPAERDGRLRSCFVGGLCPKSTVDEILAAAATSGEKDSLAMLALDLELAEIGRRMDRAQK